MALAWTETVLTRVLPSGTHDLFPPASGQVHSGRGVACGMDTGAGPPGPPRSTKGPWTVGWGGGVEAWRRHDHGAMRPSQTGGRAPASRALGPHSSSHPEGGTL